MVIVIEVTVAVTSVLIILWRIFKKSKNGKGINVNNTGDVASPKLNQQNKKGGIKGDKNVQNIGEQNLVIQHANNVNIGNASKGVVQNSNGDFSDAIKDKIRILFVDDKGEFPIVKYLKKRGYNVNCIKDIEDIDGEEVRRSDIIFLDINGVGKMLQIKNQGMGLCGALKDKYGDRKIVILYSGETKGDIFDKDAQKADASIPKDSDFLQFISLISQYGEEIIQKTDKH